MNEFNDFDKNNLLLPHNLNILKMVNHRSSALNLFLSRPKNPKERDNKKISSYYAENVFTDVKLRSYLSNDAYSHIII